MNGHVNTDYPVTFNAYKHHLNFLNDMITGWQRLDWDEVVKDLKFIGNNLTDLYCGNLSADKIIYQCHNYFLNLKITNDKKLEEWLKPFDYRKIQLSDRSLWVIKQGTDECHFIHVHPAKNSPLSIRVRATTLKTVIALKIQSLMPENKISYNLKTVNSIRTGLLGLSPVKSLDKGKGIDRLWKLFNCTNHNFY
jgi:hypothetical protein